MGALSGARLSHATIVAEPQPFDARVASLEPAESATASNRLFAVILEEIGGPRRLRVVMRKPEADAIAMHLQNMSTARPMTYAFLADLVEALGGRLAESRITRSDAATIYAAAVVSGPHGTSTLDARPSDAINLALRLRAPIRVEPAAVERQ
jgi:uncharacterized protein